MTPPAGWVRDDRHAWRWTTLVIGEVAAEWARTVVANRLGVVAIECRAGARP